MSVSGRAQIAQGKFDPILVVPSHIGVHIAYEFRNRNALPRTAIEYLILQSAEKAFTSRIIRRAALPEHGVGQAGLLHPSTPAGPAVVPTSV